MYSTNILENCLTIRFVQIDSLISAIFVFKFSFHVSFISFLTFLLFFLYFFSILRCHNKLINDKFGFSLKLRSIDAFRAC